MIANVFFAHSEHKSAWQAFDLVDRALAAARDRPGTLGGTQQGRGRFGRPNGGHGWASRCEPGADRALGQGPPAASTPRIAVGQSRDYPPTPVTIPAPVTSLGTDRMVQLAGHALVNVVPAGQGPQAASTPRDCVRVVREPASSEELARVIPLLNERDERDEGD
jgi:hypothetical protein